MEYRTHARPRSIRIKRKNVAGTAIVVILSIGLIALIIALSPLGTFLQDNVFVPLFQAVKGTDRDGEIVSALSRQESNASVIPTASPTEQISMESILQVDEKPFYILQMGVFTDEVAAVEHAQEISRMGAGGFVYRDNAVFRVFAAAYLDEDSLIKVQSQVRADGFEATPYITESARVKITLSGDRTAVEEMEKGVTFLSEVPEKLSSLSLSFDKGEIKEPDVKEQILPLQSECERELQFFASVEEESIARFTETLRKYQNTISTFLNEYDSIVSDDDLSSALKHLQIEMIMDYILFFDQT